MPRPKNVTLKLETCFLACSIGNKRYWTAKANRVPDKFTLDQTILEDIGNTLNGTAAEAVVAQYLNEEWNALAKDHTVFESDVGADIQVRWTHHIQGGLIIRPNDIRKHPSHRFVLVRGRMPDFRIEGFVVGHEAMEKKWWVEAEPEGYWQWPVHHLTDPDHLTRKPEVCHASNSSSPTSKPSTTDASLLPGISNSAD